MRELILLRHAHAEAHALGQTDFDRPLSVVGIAEAEAAGAWLRDKALAPDRALVSPARRTRETTDTVAMTLGAFECRLEDAIYEANPGTLMGLIETHRDVDRLMLVGHNPGLERLVSLLHSGQSSDYRGMPPAGIAVLSFRGDGLIEPGVATLTEFWWP